MNRKEFIEQYRQSVREVKEQRLTDHFKLLNLTPEERKTLDKYDYYSQGYKHFNTYPQNFDLYELVWLVTDVLNKYNGVKATSFTTSSATGRFPTPQRYLWLEVHLPNGEHFKEMFASYYNIKKTRNKVISPKFNTVENTEATLTNLLGRVNLEYNNEFADRIFNLAYYSYRATSKIQDPQQQF